MKKIIALGGKGMTGYYLPTEMPNYDLEDDFDITKPGILERIFEEEKPEVVINLAAVTDVVGSETDQKRCYETNTVAALHVAQLCKNYKAKYIFISSVDVFDGELRKPAGYKPGMKTNPIVVYGRSKQLAEEFITYSYPEALIIRAGWMFGGFDRDKKFISYMMRQMNDGRRTVYAVNEIHGSPTYGKDLINFILEVAETDFIGGIMHYCNAGRATRYQQALVVAEVLGWKGKVEPSNMREFPNFRALKNSVMEPSVPVRPWQEALAEYVQEWKERIK